MDEIAIRVEGLGKRFRLRHQNGGPRYRTLREELLSAPRQLLARLRQRRSAQEEFWALQDVSFEVKRGEVLGIIGRNGAGKSTLLKILSRIMDPTTGEATVYGRIGSLLEVGTGFHPELTGRENIYLSGALLGMKRDEVKRRFDEIVEFAGVEKFLDTACKHYSSGMYTRLGFAVAAHLDTEILLIDEVLAVGDAEFQRRSLQKMAEIASGGRTLLFVSHNMSAVLQLCPTVMQLGNGTVVGVGSASAIINQYSGQREMAYWRPVDKGHVNRITRIKICSEGPDFRYGASLRIDADFELDREFTVSIEITIRDDQFHPIVFLPGGLRFGREFKRAVGTHRITCKIPHLPLAAGGYYVDVALVQSGVCVMDFVSGALGFDVTSSYPELGSSLFSQRTRQGCIHIPADFSCTT